MSRLENLYSDKNVKAWGLVASESLDLQGQARGLALRWTKLVEEFSKLRPNPLDNIWLVVCDLLILDADPPPVSDGGQLLIFARRIEPVGARTITLESTKANVTIVAQEIMSSDKASLTAMFLKDDQSDPILHSLATLRNCPATLFTLDAPSSKTIEALDPTDSNTVSQLGDLLNDGELLRYGVVTTFQLGTLLSSSDAELAADQLRWVAVLADLNSVTRVMAGQARTQLGWVNEARQGLVTVPPLDFSVYSKAAVALADVLQARSDQYEKWIRMERDNEKWLSQAKLTVSLQKNESQLSVQLQRHTQTNLDTAQRALSSAAFQLSSLKAGLEQAKIDFDRGVKNWRDKEERSAALDLVLKIVTLGVAVGKVVAMVAVPGAAGAEAAGAEAAGADAEAGASVAGKTSPSEVDAAVSKVKELAGPLKEVAGGVVGVVEGVQTLVDIGKTADKMHSMASSTLERANTALDTTFTVTGLSGLDTVTGGSQVWQSLEVSMDDVFDQQTDLMNQIDGGSAFRVSFRQLVIGAEAYCSARLAVAAASDRLAEALLRSQATQRAVKLCEGYTEQLAQDNSLYLQIQQAAFGTLLDAKRAVYMQLEHYCQAIRYFTLGDPPSMPDITAPAIDFISQCATCSGYELALDQLQPTPQPMNVSTTVTCNDRKRTTDGTDGTIVLQIDLNNVKFDDLARIRIDSIAVSLADGDGKTIFVDELHIGSGGTYRDRTANGVIKTFTGNPWIRIIKYDTAGKPEIGGSTYARYGQLIFKPTPFTTWTIRPKDPAVASRIASVTLTLTGESSDCLQAG